MAVLEGCLSLSIDEGVCAAGVARHAATVFPAMCGVRRPVGGPVTD